MNLNNKISFMRSLADGWDLYANSSFLADNPSVAVQNKRPGIYGRSTDTSVGTPAFVRFDSGSAGAIDPDDLVVWLGYASTNGTALTWRIRFSTVADFTSTTYDSGSMVLDAPFAGRNFSHALKDGMTGNVSRYVEVSVWATAASHVDIGRINIGEPWQPVRNVRLFNRVEPSPQENVSVQSGSRGQEFDVGGTVYWQAQNELIFSDEDDLKAEWADLIERVGQSGNVLYIADPTETTYRQQQFVSGRFTELSLITQNDEDRWSIAFTIEEFH